MTNNIYDTPVAEVVDKERPKKIEPPQFYVVSQRKFLALYFATFGLYSLYWFYLNWAQQKKVRQLQILPIARGIFNLLFVHALFAAVDQRIKDSGRQWAWNPNSLATAWAVLWLADRGLAFMAQSGSLDGSAALTGFLTLPLMGYVTYQAQCAINFAENDPQGERNSRFSPVNLVWVAGGLMMWVLAGLGAGMSA